jgi:hypothetical protein
MMRVRSPRGKAAAAFTVLLVVLFTLVACGSDDDGSNGETVSRTAPEGRGLRDAFPSAVEAQAYKDLQPAFWQRFQYHSNVEADQSVGEERIFRAGVTVCLAIATTGLSIQEIMSGIAGANGITHDGAESIAAAATEILCPERGYRLATRTTREADQIAERLSAELGAGIDKEAAERNAKLICSFLEHHNGDSTGLTDYVFSEMIPFTTAPVGLNEVKILVRVSANVRCFGQDLGPYWYGA